MNQSHTESLTSEKSSSQNPLEQWTQDLTSGQKEAFEGLEMFLTLGKGYYLLQGYAGTGKTFLMGRLLRYLEATSDKRVALTASTHKAVKVLRDFTDSNNMYTTHAFFALRQDIDKNGNIYFRRDPNMRGQPPCEKYHIAVVDEASMLADEVFDEVEQWVNYGGLCIFVGDPCQIPPVGMKNSLPFEVEVQRELGFRGHTLTEIVRQAQENPIIMESMGVREAPLRAIPGLSYENKVNGPFSVEYAEYDKKKGLSDEILALYRSKEFEEDPDHVKVIAWTNRIVDKYNRQIRAHLFGENLPRIMKNDKLIANAPITEGRQILVNNNEDMEVLEVTVDEDQLNPETTMMVYKAKVTIFGMKGDFREAIINILHESSEKDMKKELNRLAEEAKSRPRGSFAAKDAWFQFYKLKERYADVKYSYAITAHKSQGSTYNHAVVMLFDLLNNPNVEERNRIIYTAITRPKNTLKIIH